MRVALVLYGALEQRSGGFLYDRMLVGALRRAGDDVEVISLPWDSRVRGLARGLSPRLRSQLLGWDGDCILEDELAHPTLMVLHRAAQRARGPLRIAIVHHLGISETERPGRTHRAVERAYLRGVDRFLFNSTITRQSVEAVLRRPAEGIVVTPGGDRLGPMMSADDVISRARDAAPLRILFIGNIIPRKGLHTLVKALGMLKSDTFRLTVVGSEAWDPRYAARVRKAIGSFGLSGRVRFAGALSDDCLAAGLRTHHVLAVPSLYEGFGIVYLEAMRCGLVPIGSTAGGAAEIIEDGSSGCLVPREDPAALAAVMARLAERPERLVALSLGALRRSAEFPGWTEGMERARGWLRELTAFREG